jgi:YD repeat-containing protein
VKATIEGDELVIRLPLNKSPVPSSSGKTLVVASTHGNRTTEAGGTLMGGAAQITLPALPGVGTYGVRARVSDLAGNQGSSAVQTLQVTTVTNPWHVTDARVLRADPEAGQPEQQLGDLTVSHPLDLDQSPGTGQSGDSALVYHSGSVSVRPVVQALVPSDNASSLPATIGVQLTWDGVLQSQGPLNYSTAGFNPGDVLVAAAQVASPVTTTGRHTWGLRVVIPGQADQNLSGVTYVAPQDASPFGAGWTFAPVDQLVNIPADGNGPAGQLRVFGTGGWRFYVDNGNNTFTGPPEDNGGLVRNGDGTFTYTTPEGVKTNFDSSGRQTSVVSADGKETLSFTYTGGLLTGLTAIDGAQSTFSYASGLLSSIATVGPRSWAFAHTGTALTQITDPDDGTRNLTYDGNNHLTGETFGGLANEWAYDSGSGLLTGLTWGNSSSPSVSALKPAPLYGLGALALAPSQPGAVAQASLTDPLGRTTVWQLDGDGRPLLERDANGAQTTWQRDAAGRVTSTTDLMQRTTAYARDSLGYVTLETLPDTATLQYAYQGAFHALTLATDERGFTTQYAYDSSGHETLTTDALTDTTASAYDPGTGLLTAVTDARNHTTQYAYDADRRLTLTTDARSGQTTYTYDSNGNPATTRDALLHTTQTAYDSMSRLTSQTDPLLNSSSWTYDVAGLLLSQTDAAGTLTRTGYDPFQRGLAETTDAAVGTPVESLTLSRHDAAGQVTATRDAEGNWSNDAYDAAGNESQTTDAAGDITRATFDLDGEQTGTRDALGNWTTQAYNLRGWGTRTTDALGKTSTQAYDAAGDVTQTTDALSKSWTTAYDKLGRATLQTDPLTHTVATTYDGDSNVSTVTDGRGFTTRYAYDELNRLTQTTEAAGTSSQRVTNQAYDAVGNVTWRDDGAGVTQTVAYDALDRQTLTTDALAHTTQTAYDKVGDVTATTDGLNKTTTFAYDAQHRQTQTTDPLGHSTRQVLDADGEAAASLDGLGDASQHFYDPAGRETLTIDPLGGFTWQGYDGDGHRLSLADALGNTTQWVYDSDGRQVAQIDPQAHVSTQAYDADGHLTQVVDRLGRTDTSAYDDAGRLQTEKWYAAGASQPYNTKSYTYDANDNLLTAGDSNGSYTRGYDPLNQVTSVADPFGVTLSYAYDAAGRQTSLTDSLGGVVGSTYDAADRLTSRTLSGTGVTPLRIDLGYDNRNELTTETRYSDLNGTQRVGGTVLSYDDAGRVTAVTHNNPAGTTNLDGYGYSYDAADRVTQETWQLGATKNYSYDAAGELLSDGTNTYSYRSFAATKERDRTALSNLSRLVCSSRKEQGREVLYHQARAEPQRDPGVLRPRHPPRSFADGRPGLFPDVAALQADRLEPPAPPRGLVELQGGGALVRGATQGPCPGCRPGSGAALPALIDARAHGGQRARPGQSRRHPRRLGVRLRDAGELPHVPRALRRPRAGAGGGRAALPGPLLLLDIGEDTEREGMRFPRDRMGLL